MKGSKFGSAFSWRPQVEVQALDLNDGDAGVYKKIGYYGTMCNVDVAFGTGMFEGWALSQDDKAETMVVSTTRKPLPGFGNFVMTVDDCNGVPMYYLVQENYKFGSFDIDLRICRDPLCEDMIGYSKKSGIWSVVVELYPVIADGSIASNYSVRAAKPFEMVDLSPQWTILTNDMNAEVSDPRIITAIVTERMFRTQDLDPGLCNGFIAFGIVFACMIALFCVCFCCCMAFQKAKGGGSNYQ